MNKKMLIIFFINFLILIIIMTTGFLMMWNKISSFESQGKEESQKASGEESADVMIGHTYPLDTFIVNLAGQDVKRYLRVTLELELSDPELSEEIEKRIPQIRDTILMILPTKGAEGIQSVEGKTALRDEIITKLNTLLVKGNILNIYFTEFVIQ